MKKIEIKSNIMHQPFRFPTIDDLRRKITNFGLDLQLQEDISPLFQPCQIYNLTCPNRMVIHPMEGCDGLQDGTPSTLTRRRYERFGRSGAGIIWFEATAIEQDHSNILNNPRANPRQLMLTENNIPYFQELIRLVEQGEKKLKGTHQAFGKSLKILQITHSGRYTRPDRVDPRRMYYYDALDTAYGQDRSEGRVLTDNELEDLPEAFDQSVNLAKKAGFDGVDIKTCHRYLLNESLSAFTRNGKYGGESYENRIRLLKSILSRVISKYSSAEFLISLRYNLFDGIPYPYGWGTKPDPTIDVEHFTNSNLPPPIELSEPIKLLKDLYSWGIRLVNLTLANPYFNSYVSRPFDKPIPGSNFPPEHPLMGVYRFISLTRLARSALPSEMKLIGTGYSWLRQYAPFLAAAEIAMNRVDFVGFGRMAFANPEFGQQIAIKGGIDPSQTCITCSKCTELMRKKSVTGCVIRDADTYMPYYRGTIKSEDLKR